MSDDSGFGYYPQQTSQYPGPPGQPGWPGHYGEPPRPRRRGGVLTHLLVAVLAAGLAAGVTVALDHTGSSPATNTGASLPGASLPGAGAVPNPGASQGGGSSAGNGSEQAAVNKVEPGLVIINTTLQYSSETGEATGMVINSDGLVLTNNHVIEGSTKITARLAGTGKTYQGKVVGYDKTGDIALIQLQDASRLRTVPVGNSATVKTGAPVVALGNADGQGTIIPAGGRITGVGKSITASDQGGSITSERLHGMFETNADIVSGDSGGPLVSQAGQVVAMDTAGGTASFGQQQSGAGFAIPIDTALAVARQIAAGHASSTVTIGYPSFIGIFIGSGHATNPQVQAQQQEQNGFGGFGGFGGGTPSCFNSNANVGVPSNIAPVSSGTLVDGTICGSPAASVGITGGAVITAVNGQSTSSPASLAAVLAKLRPGDTVSMSWVSPSGHQSTSRLALVPGPPQ